MTCCMGCAAVAASCVAAALALAVLAVLFRRFLAAHKRTGAESGPPPSKYVLRGLWGAPPGGGSRGSSGGLDRAGSTTPPTPVASTAGKCLGILCFLDLCELSLCLPVGMDVY